MSSLIPNPATARLDLIGMTSTELTSYLKVDQTGTPQSIVNGVPLMTTAVDGEGSPYQLVNKEYVDLAVSALELTEFFHNELADLGGLYRVMDDAPDTAGSVVSAAVPTGAAVNIFNFITNTDEPGLDRLLAGVYDCHAHIYRSVSITRTVSAYFILYKRDIGGTETPLATSETIEVTSTATGGDAIDFHVVLSSEQALDVTDRLVVKWYAVVTGAGGADPTLTMETGGVTNSHFSIKVNALDLKNIFVPYTGALANVDLGNKNLTTSGIGIFQTGGVSLRINDPALGDAIEITDGTWILKLLDNSSSFTGWYSSSTVSSLYAKLQCATSAAEFGDGIDIVYLADGTYAINVASGNVFMNGGQIQWSSNYVSEGTLSGSWYLTNGTLGIGVAPGGVYGIEVDVSGLSATSAGSFYDGTNTILIGTGSLGIDVNGGYIQMGWSSANYGGLFVGDGTGNQFYASDGTYVLNATGNSLFNGLIGVGAAATYDVDIRKDGSANSWIGYSTRDTSSSSIPALMGSLRDSTDAYSLPGIWFTASTPSYTNYAFLYDGASTIFNAPSGQAIRYRINNANQWSILSTGNLVSGADGTGTQSILTMGNISGSTSSFASGAYALRAGGGNPCIQVDFERASGGFAGNFFEIWASDTTSAATARLGQVGLYGSFNTDPAVPTAAWIYFSCTDSATAYLDAPLLVLPDNSVRINGDNVKLGFGAAGIADSYILYDAAQLEFYSVLGGYDFTTAANTNVVLNFIGTTNSGVMTWVRANDRFQFSDDVQLPDNELLILGTGADASISFTGSEMSFRSDTTTSTDGMRFRAGTAGYILQVGANTKMTLNNTVLNLYLPVVSTYTAQFGSPTAAAHVVNVGWFRSFELDGSSITAYSDATISFQDIGTTDYQVWCYMLTSGVVDNPYIIKNKTSSSFDVQFYSSGSAYSTVHVMIIRGWNA